MLQQLKHKKIIIISITSVIILSLCSYIIYLHYKDKPEPIKTQGEISLELNSLINDYNYKCKELKDLTSLYNDTTIKEEQQRYMLRIGSKYNELQKLANSYNSKSNSKINIPIMDDFFNKSLEELIKMSF